MAQFLNYSAIYIESFENYQKRSYRNKCQICTSSGAQTLTVPLIKGKNNNSPIRSTLIDYRQNWQSIHLKSIQSAYGKSPFFVHYKDWLVPIIMRPYDSIFELNWAILVEILSLLNIGVDLRKTSQFYKLTDESIVDFRNYSNKKQNCENYNQVYYEQVFSDRLGFTPNLSILDLLFCRGPETTQLLQQSIQIRPIGDEII